MYFQKTSSWLLILLPDLDLDMKKVHSQQIQRWKLAYFSGRHDDVNVEIRFLKNQPENKFNFKEPPETSRHFPHGFVSSACYFSRVFFVWNKNMNSCLMYFVV